MESFDYSGYWWLPENEENKYFGNLSFSHNEGLRLEMFGSFALDALEPGTSMSIGEIKQYPVIKGITREGKYLTLFDCDSAGLALSAPGFPSEKFIASYAFEEANPSSKSSPSTKFRGVFIQFTYLPDWIGFSGIRENVLFDEETKLLDRLEVIYRPADEIIADLGQARIAIVEGYSSRSDLVQGVSLKPNMLLEIDIDERISFQEWYSQFVIPLRDFFTLATRRHNAVTSLALFSNVDGGEPREGVPKISPTKVYYRQPSAKGTRHPKTLYDHDMLFGFSDVKEEFYQVLGDWLVKRVEFRSTMDLFFAVESSIGTYLENDFLNFTQALEVYYRKRFRTTVNPEIVREHEAKKKAVIDIVPEEYREWLSKRLEIDNQLKLNERLLELFKHTEAVTSKLITSGDKFCRRVTKTRNFLVHYSGKLRDVMEGEELFRAAQSLSYMTQVCLMLELGLSEERIVKLFERNQKFLFTAFQIRQARYWE